MMFQVLKSMKYSRYENDSSGGGEGGPHILFPHINQVSHIYMYSHYTFTRLFTYGVTWMNISIILGMLQIYMLIYAIHVYCNV